MNIRKLETVEQFSKILDTMKEPFYLFKHSTICPISARVMDNITNFMEQNPSFPIYQVLVIESRSLSNHISEVFKKVHQSPQIFLVSNGSCLWDASHMAINEKVMAEKINELVQNA